MADGDKHAEPDIKRTSVEKQADCTWLPTFADVLGPARPDLPGSREFAVAEDEDWEGPDLEVLPRSPARSASLSSESDQDFEILEVTRDFSRASMSQETPVAGPKHHRHQARDDLRVSPGTTSVSVLHACPANKTQSRTESRSLFSDAPMCRAPPRLPRPPMPRIERSRLRSARKLNQGLSRWALGILFVSDREELTRLQRTPAPNTIPKPREAYRSVPPSPLSSRLAIPPVSCGCELNV